MQLCPATMEKEQDQVKVERLYAEYSESMFYAANRILQDRYLAEDVVQQSFLRVIENLDHIDENDGNKTRAFLLVIVKHISIDLYRKRKKENWISYEETEDYAFNAYRFSYEEKDEIYRAFLKLPAHYAVVLDLKYIRGYSDEEIGDLLQLSTVNVRQRLFRAKKKLSGMINCSEQAKQQD